MSWWFDISYALERDSLVGQMVKNLPAIQETQVWSLGWEDPLEDGSLKDELLRSVGAQYAEISGEITPEWRHEAKAKKKKKKKKQPSCGCDCWQK